MLRRSMWLMVLLVWSAGVLASSPGISRLEARAPMEATYPAIHETLENDV